MAKLDFAVERLRESSFNIAAIGVGIEEMVEREGCDEENGNYGCNGDPDMFFFMSPLLGSMPESMDAG